MRFVTIEILNITLVLKNEKISFSLGIERKVSFICRQFINPIACVHTNLSIKIESRLS